MAWRQAAGRWRVESATVRAIVEAAYLDAPAGALELTAANFADADAFGAGSVTATYSLTAAPYADPDDFGAGSVAIVTTITAADYADPDAFGTGAVTTTYALVAASFADADAFGTGSVAAVYAIEAAGFVDPDDFGEGSLAEAPSLRSITAGLHVNLPAFGLARVGPVSIGRSRSMPRSLVRWYLGRTGLRDRLVIAPLVDAARAAGARTLAGKPLD